LGDLGVDGNIKLKHALKNKIEGVDWILAAQDRI
jgi:hypothetical protein